MFIDSRKIYTYFQNNFSLKKTSKGWHSFKCPMCDELENRKKMAVNFSYRTVKCWICQYKENVVDFVSDYEGISYVEAKRMLEDSTVSDINLSAVEVDNSQRVLSEIKMPFGYTSILDGDGALGVRARKYLKKRGFNLKELDRLGVGYCSSSPPENSDEDDYFGYIIIPFKSRGKLVYFIGRDFIGNFLRYKNPNKEIFAVGKGDLFFNEDALYIYDEVFVLEGWSDAFTIGRQAIASLGAELSKTQKSKILKSDADIFTLVPDAGNNGAGVPFYLKALEFAMELSSYKRVRIVDLNNLDHGKDVNEIGRDKFMEIYNNTPILTEKEILLTYLEYDA